MTADRYNRSDLSDQALKAWQNAHPELAPDAGQPRPEMKLCHDYDKEIPMTNDKLTPQELRGEFAALHTEIADLRTALAAVLDGLRQAATVPVPQAGATKSFVATCIVHSMDDNGRDAYKLRGGCYAKNGVRIWPEVLPLLGIAEPVPMGITQLTPPINVLVEMHDYTDPATHETRVTPYKVVGLA